MNPAENTGPLNNPNQFNQGFQNTPNSVAVLVLGILSIVFCLCYGIIGAILGIIALVLANQGEKAYALNPSLYTLSSYKNLKAGKVCAIIGLSISGLYIIFLIVYFIIAGTVAFGALNSALGS